jgi:hypothetical protein
MLPKRLRFSLRTLAIFVALVCVALWAIPTAIEWSKWRLVRGVVVDTIDQIAASPNKPAIYMGIAWHSTYVLANVEIDWNLSTNSGSAPKTNPRSDAIFVEMPGKVHTWVHSPDEVMQLLREND